MQINQADRESAEAMTVSSDLTLAHLGWRSFFAEQVSAEQSQNCQPVRVMSVHRGQVTVLGEGIEDSISSSLTVQRGAADRPTVGDWLLIDRSSRSLVRILDRTNLFKRPAPGDGRRVQLIAANIDTLFIVSSCDQDFNVARIERYLVLAREVGVRPVLVLTKADLSPAPERLVEEARALQSGLRVELVDGRYTTSAGHLAGYCGLGETVALVGSSGVGKSTLVNTLKGSESIATQPVREDDGKGRHTTTVREMHRLAGGADGPAADGGGWLVDTPGMRELQMSEVASGVTEVFDDVTAVTLECRFANCTHTDEPGCAIHVAMTQGDLDPARVERWRKLAREDAENSGAVAMRRSRRGKVGDRR
ncbi:ribosome small subunit-dependent GTPase A [Sphingomonas sp. LR60]|uniref:ribosome small subunit-dependent GTPase A n=1 Tax=Sphingomonas sp. LR60 TaxID=3050233 RepID=UPI002FE149A9